MTFFLMAGVPGALCKTRRAALLFVLGFALAGFVPVALAQPQPLDQADAMALLARVQQAARTLDYSGVYAYQQGSYIQSSRIVHVVDGTGERERIEVLDGQPREFLSHNDEVQCLIPEKKAVVKEKRRGDRFPGLIADGACIGWLGAIADRFMSCPRTNCVTATFCA